ncbi:HutD family protein [Agrobacterium sp. fls2-241-TYG-188a]|uniref:HutD/Ves family protein n=1 Tax=Agrobacterium sp. fls2-241-TYG-188a TaxID=3040275 RepID=UPI002549C27A|nr:HutD family protein [Agrobacterium sp. fls2-241-TYG-188a]
MALFRAGEHKRMPWKNGGGETVEIAVFPADASVDNFDWRISMATVASDGAFSIFSGIDRTLSILDGNGMGLEVDGRAAVLLTRESQPLTFAADVPVEAMLVDGPITDLNVMTRRGRFSHSVERVTGRFCVSRNAPSDRVFVLATGDAFAVSAYQSFALKALDAISIDAATDVQADDIVCYVIRLTPQG